MNMDLNFQRKAKKLTHHFSFLRENKTDAIEYTWLGFSDWEVGGKRKEKPQKCHHQTRRLWSHGSTCPLLVAFGVDCQDESGR